MQLLHPMRSRPPIARLMLTLVLSGLMIFLSACGGDPQVRQGASTAQTRFTQTLQHAQQIGVPATFLRTVFQKEEQLQNSSAPFSLFGMSDDQATNNYYHQLNTGYAQLTTLVQAAITASTTQAREETQQDLQTLRQTLTQGSTQHLPVQLLSNTLTQVQSAMPQAQTPRDFAGVRNQVQNIAQSFVMMKDISASLATFGQSIQLLQRANLDTTISMMSYQNDKLLLGEQHVPADFTILGKQVQAHIQQILTIMTQAIPALAADKIQTFSQQIQLMQAEGAKAEISQAHQAALQQDQALVHNHMSIVDYETFAARIDTDTQSALFDQLHTQALHLLQTFHTDAQTWNATHAYYDVDDGQSYPLNAGYLSQGIGSDLDAEVSQAASVDDIQQALTMLNDSEFDLHLLESDYLDPTPYYQVHQTDIQALNHYQLQKGQVIVVSLAEQALRLYQDGQLVRAFQVTTGRYELPSLPGMWSVLARESPTVFHSSEPRTSPYWYPPTPIHYAILYHDGGYFIHDSWWRSSYGPGTQFPHSDASGNQQFAGNGSHGCINMQENDAAWLYNNTSWSTPIVIY